MDTSQGGDTSPSSELPLIEIKHRYSGAVLFSGRYATVKDAVQAAVKAKADLRGSDLRGSNFRGSDLRGSNFRGSNFRGSNFRGSDLRYSDLRGSDLRYSDLRYSDLRYSDLRGSDLSSSNFRGSILPDGFRAAHLCFGGWPVTVTTQYTTIGCQRHDNHKWLAWLPEDVAHMHGKASEWWADHGEAVKAVIRNVMQVPANTEVSQ